MISSGIPGLIPVHARHPGSATMIIDFRMRPPVGPYLASVYGNVDKMAQTVSRVGFSQAPSAAAVSMDLLTREMRDAGIGHAVIPARVAATGAVPNAAVAEIVENGKGFFSGMAALDPSDPDAALADLDSYVTNGPLRGVGFEPGMLPEPLHADDKRLYPLYDACQEKGIFVSLMTAAACGPDISFTSPELIDNVARDFPRLAIVDAHGGWPWVTQNLYLAHRHPNVILCPDFIMFNMPGMHDYLMAANYFLQDRFLFATGYPHMGHGAAVEFYRKHIRPEVQEKIFYGNAARLIGLGC